MKAYRSIEYYSRGIFGANVIAFDKLDGSNLRFEWVKKHSKKNLNNGFNKFGTRKQIIDINHSQFGNGVKIFMEKYSNTLDKIFREDKDFRNAQKITCFAEYFGEHSFAGFHHEDDKENMNLVLFDIDIYQKGILKPRDFIKKFKKLEIPNVIYEGVYNNELINNVKNNIYNLKEGVVVKGITLTKRKNVENVWMVKIKTNEWLKKLKNSYGEEKLLEEVNNENNLINLI